MYRKAGKGLNKGIPEPKGLSVNKAKQALTVSKSAIQEQLKQHGVQYLFELYEGALRKTIIEYEQERLKKQLVEHQKPATSRTNKSTSQTMIKQKMPKITPNRTPVKSRPQPQLKKTTKKPVKSTTPTPNQKKTNNMLELSFSNEDNSFVLENGQATHASPKFRDLGPTPKKRALTPTKRAVSPPKTNGKANTTVEKKQSSSKSPLSKSLYLEREMQINQELQSRLERIKQLKLELLQLEYETYQIEAQRSQYFAKFHNSRK